MNPSSLPELLDSYPEPSLLGLAVGTAVALFIGLLFTLRGYLRHRSTQQRLNDSQTRMKALMDTAVDGVTIIDAKGRILEFNASAERIFGWRRSEIVGKNVTELMDHSIRASHDGFLANYLRTGEGKIIGRGRELQGIRKDGATMPIRLAIGHAHLPDQDVFVGFVTDISDRVEMELAMRVSEQQLRSLVRNIPGICFRSLASEPRSTLFISNAVERFTGYPAADFLGQPPKRLITDHIHPDDRNLLRSAIAQALASDRDFHMQYRLLHRDGTQRWVWGNGSGVRDGSGRVKWIDGVILDITERHEMEGQFRLAKEVAERAAQARSDFLANMSHEIRTPLNAILGFTDVMLNNRPVGDDRRYLETIRGAGDSLLHVLNDVLDSAKLDRGAVDLEMLDVDVRQLVNVLRETMSPGAAAKGLTLAVAVADDVPPIVRGDRFRIGQVLTNLLGNAIKFTHAGRVDLLVRLADAGLLFEVRDTGIGIASDRLQAIFEPFTQADASMSRRFGGTGLGTTISKQLVVLMQGRIWVESEPGVGSRFYVELPLQASSETVAVGAGLERIARRSLRVLIADDVKQNLEMMQLLLVQKGHHVVLVEDGEAAIAAGKQGGWDIILMDIHMSGISGLAATREIRAHEAALGRHTPIVALTAAVLSDDRAAALAAGMDGFVCKPVDIDTLDAEINRLTGTIGGGWMAGRVDLALPDSSDLDAVSGLARWGGKRDIYQQAMTSFVTTYANTGSLLAGALAKGDVAEIVRLAHKVRGAAANLGLVQLAQRLDVLERADLEPRQYAGTQILIGAVDQAMAAASAAVASYMRETRNETRPEWGELDFNQIEQAGVRLMEPLSRATLDERAWCDFRLLVPDDIPGMAALATAIDDLNLNQAYGHLADVLRYLKSCAESEMS